MPDPMKRRTFLKKAAAVSSLPVVGAAFEEKALLSQQRGGRLTASALSNKLPLGKIGDLEVSRIICGGNLISGFAHSRDLIYVSPLLKHYFTDEKVCETLSICEENGINTAILRVDDQVIRIVNKYRNEWGGKMQWIAQIKPKENDLTSDIRRCVDNGAVAAYIHGGVGDRWVEAGKCDLVNKVLDHIRREKIPAGVAAHLLQTVKGYTKAGVEPDFYMKTLNAKNYWSAGPREKCDNIWSETPEETIAFMRAVEKPWIAYKILGAGAIHPKEGFPYVFQNGADFACVGMFDFQVVEDVIIAKKTLGAVNGRRRPWRG